MPKPVIGIMGPGSNPTEEDIENALQLGKLCAENDFVTLTGGHNIGVMDAALKGSKGNGRDTIGILAFGNKDNASEYADICVVTAMGSARNNINVLTSDVVIACGCESGTLSEIAMALKAKKQVILLTQNEQAQKFLKDLNPDQIIVSYTPEEAIDQVKELLKS